MAARKPEIAPVPRTEKRDQFANIKRFFARAHLILKLSTGLVRDAKHLVFDLGFFVWLTYEVIKYIVHLLSG